MGINALTGDASTLRIATAGSVDDGKSTLIGRLLHDTKSVFEDQLRAVVRDSRRYGDGNTNLALLTDGLRAEREQGITIDVAHRYFTTPRRSFILADTPGHAEYTRNMVTGASTSDVAVVLVDARHGVVEQTRRHLLISSLLGTGHIVLAINKMDLVDWQEPTFRTIADEARQFVDAMENPVPTTAIPMSALLGDNVVNTSASMRWYEGPPLLTFLEDLDAHQTNDVGARVHVQRVIRPQGGADADFRGQAGVVSGGSLHVGDPVVVMPSGRTSTVRALYRWGDPVDEAAPGHAVAVELAPDVDVARGDVLVAADATPPLVGDEVEADVCWMIDRLLVPGSRWWFKHGTRSSSAVVTEVLLRIDLTTLDQHPSAGLALNELGRIRLQLGEKIVADPYSVLPSTGCMILIDPADNNTAGAVMIRTVRSSDQAIR